MKTELRRSGLSWKLTIVVLTGGLLMFGVGCICINMQVTVPSASKQCCGSPGGAPSHPMLPPAGGPFTPIEMVVIPDSGSFTICTNPPQTVTKVHVNFYPPMVQAPTTGETHFQGRIKNMTTGAFINKNYYVLQWWISIQNQGCATNMPPGIQNDKKFPIQPGAYYKFIAHFKPGYEPTGNPLPTIQLEGAWTY